MATPPSLRKERVAQTGLQICQPCGPVTGDKPQETLVSALRLTRMRKAGRARTGLELCRPYGPLRGNESGISFCGPALTR
jgi:hypothetical protein